MSDVTSLRWPAYPWNGPSYVLQGTCGNCDRTALVTVTRGHEAPGYRNGPECPYCGCSQWVGWHAPEEGGRVTLAEAQTILARQSAEMDAQRKRVVSTDPDSVDTGAPAGGREAALEAAPEKDMLAGLRAAAQIPHTRINDYAPSDDVVASLADLLAEAEGSAEGNGYVAMALAAISAIGGREAALERFFGLYQDWRTGRFSEKGQTEAQAHDAVILAAREVSALTPTDAAKAVRELVDAALACTAADADISGDTMRPTPAMLARLRAAAVTVGGAGDA